MKHTINTILLVFTAFILFTSCDKEDQNKINYCETPTGDVHNNGTGRIYRHLQEFYYIGSIDTTKQFQGGLIPCNNMLNEAIPEIKVGDLVIYSGVIKQANNAEEPAYYGIELTEIKKVY